MILLDTSLLVEYFRSKDDEFLRKMGDLDSAICGITRAEILCGSRGDKQRSLLIDALDVFHQISIPESLWDDIGDTLAVLRQSGITVPFTDVFIATVAVASGLQIWTRDKQFVLIQKLVPQLQLFDEG